MQLPQLNKIPKWLVISFLVISFIGFADASFLTIEHFRGETPPCTITDGCGTVTTSQYSEIFGIPIALGGALYYLAIFILCLAYLDTKNSRLLSIATILTALGFLFSAWLVFVQLTILKAICEYCMLSALSTTILFILSSCLWFKNKNTNALT